MEHEYHLVVWDTGMGRWVNYRSDSSLDEVLWELQHLIDEREHIHFRVIHHDEAHLHVAIQQLKNPLEATA